MRELMWGGIHKTLPVSSPQLNLARDVSPRLVAIFRTQSSDVNKIAGNARRSLKFAVTIFRSECPLNWSERLRWNVFRRLRRSWI